MFLLICVEIHSCVSHAYKLVRVLAARALAANRRTPLWLERARALTVLKETVQITTTKNRRD